MAPGGQSFASARIQPFMNTKAVRIAAAAGILATLCGTVAFVSLVLRDHGRPRVMVNEQARPAPRPSTHLPAPSSATSVVPKDDISPTPFFANKVPAGKKGFLASEVSGPVTVGPLKLRVTKTDAANHTYDLSVQSGRRLFTHKHIGIDQPLWISAGRGKSAIQLVVTRVQGDTVAGYWSEVARSARVGSASKVKHR